MQTQLEATLLRLGNLPEGSVVYHDAGTLQVQQKRCWLLRPLFQKKPASDEEKTRALLPLFKQATHLPDHCLPGLRYCQSHFERLASPSDEIVQALELCRRHFPPANFSQIPADVLLLIKGVSALRIATRGLRQQLCLAKVFQQQKILARAIDGEPAAVRRLASYISLQIEAATVFQDQNGIQEAKNAFSSFYPQATRSAKKLFWRAIFCQNLFVQFKTLLPLSCITDLPLKFTASFSAPPAIAELIDGSPELQRIELRMAKCASIRESLIDALKNCSKLTHCHVRRISVFSQYETFWLQELPLFRNLQSLRLDDFFLNSSAKAVVHSLDSLRSLFMTRISGPDLMVTIGEQANLEELFIKTRFVTWERIEKEVSKLTNLRTLAIHVTDQGNCSCRFVIALLERLPNLTRFVLHTFIDGTPEDLELLRQALVKRSSLQAFSIRLNIDLSLAFAKTLLTKPSLVCLGLVVNASSAFCQALQESASVSVLQELLYGQRIPDATLFGQIAKLTHLHTLRVASQFTDAAAKQLQEAPCLRKFSFVSERIFPQKLTDVGLDSLFQIATLQRCKIWAPHHIPPNVAIDTKLRSLKILGREGDVTIEKSLASL